MVLPVLSVFFTMSLQLVLPPGLLAECLPHLLRLSAAYRDVSCEDLSDATWEQLSRKLGLVAEVGGCVSMQTAHPLPCLRHTQYSTAVLAVAACSFCGQWLAPKNTSLLGKHASAVTPPVWAHT